MCTPCNQNIHVLSERKTILANVCKQIHVYKAINSKFPTKNEIFLTNMYQKIKSK